MIHRLAQMNFDYITNNFKGDIRKEVIPFLTANILRAQNGPFQKVLWDVFSHAAFLTMVQENGLKKFFQEQASGLTGEKDPANIKIPKAIEQALQPESKILIEAINRLKQVTVVLQGNAASPAFDYQDMAFRFEPSAAVKGAGGEETNLVRLFALGHNGVHAGTLMVRNRGFHGYSREQFLVISKGQPEPSSLEDILRMQDSPDWQPLGVTNKRIFVTGGIFIKKVYTRYLFQAQGPSDGSSWSITPIKSPDAAMTTKVPGESTNWAYTDERGNRISIVYYPYQDLEGIKKLFPQFVLVGDGNDFTKVRGVSVEERKSLTGAMLSVIMLRPGNIILERQKLVRERATRRPEKSDAAMNTVGTEELLKVLNSREKQPPSDAVMRFISSNFNHKLYEICSIRTYVSNWLEFVIGHKWEVEKQKYFHYGAWRGDHLTISIDPQSLKTGDLRKFLSIITKDVEIDWSLMKKVMAVLDSLDTLLTKQQMLTLKWERPFKSGEFIINVAPNGIVIGTEHGKTVRLLNPQTGENIWEKSFKFALDVIAVTPNGFVIAAKDPTEVILLDPRTGKEKWQKPFLFNAHPITSSHIFISVIPDGVMVGLLQRKPFDSEKSYQSNTMSLLDLRTGDEKWQKEDDILFSNGFVTPDGKGLVIGQHYDRGVMLLNSESGKRKWIGEGGKLLAVTPDGKGIVVYGKGIKLLNPRTGNAIWIYDRFHPESSAVIPDGIVVGDKYGRVVLLDQKTGNKIWEEQFGAGVREIIVMPDGLMLYTEDGRVRLLDPRTGEQKWQQIVGGLDRDRLATIAVTSDGIVVGTEDGKIKLMQRANTSTATDKAAIAKVIEPNLKGGIDLNTSNGMQWQVTMDGKGVEMNVDAAAIARVRREGIDSLSPVIFRITPIASIWPLVGLQAPVK